MSRVRGRSGFCTKYASRLNSAGVSLSSSPLRVTTRRSRLTSVSPKWKTLRALRRNPPQDGADAGQQFARAERLHHVVVGADFEQQDLVHLVPDRAQHDDGSLHFGGTQLLADFHTVHARQAQIHQNQVRTRHDGLLETRAAIARQHGPEVLLLQHDADGIPQTLVVVDDQYRLHSPIR